jgi:hypothetical protein
MLNLASTSHVLRLVTGAAADIRVHRSWVDLSGTTVTPDGGPLAPITTATTTTVVSAPAASTIPSVTAQKIIGSPGIRLYNGTCLLHGALTSATTATFFSGELTIMEK